MNALIAGLGWVLDVTRGLVFAVAVGTGALCALDWAVRTRRISPFSGLGRFARARIDPLLAPVERRIVRGGGNPTSAPWWALGVVVIGGILLISLLDFLRGVVAQAAFASQAGPRGILVLLVVWGFGLLRLALLVRVISSWLPVSPHSPWLRWTYPLTDWFLRPLQRIVPRIGPIDISPIVAYFLLGLIERVVVGVL